MFKKGFVKRFTIAGIFAALLSGGFFASRLFNLTIIPIFTDEAIYLRWAQIALTDPRWRFISLIDGKQPLFIWLLLPVLKLMSDPLVAGRLISVCLGFVAMAGFAVFGWLMTKRLRGAVIGAVLYLCLPFFLVYDRLALYEALLVAISVWSLLLTYLFGKLQRLDLALLLGMTIGAGLLTKSSANFSWYLLPLTLLLIKWPKNGKLAVFAKWLGLTLVVIVQAQIYENITRLSEFRHVIAQKNLSFIYSFSEFLQDPFRVAQGNLTGLVGWLVTYCTVPFFLVTVVAAIFLLRRKWQEGLFFLGFFLAPFISLAFFGKVIYPRFLSFMLPALLIPVVIFVSHLWETKIQKPLLFILAAVVLVPILVFDLQLLTNPINAPLPYADRQQFINDWPAGYGIKEAIALFSEEAKHKHIYVGTEGTFGLFPMALELYLGTNPNVTFKAYWPVSEVPSELQELAKTYPTYLLFKERQDIPREWPLILINEYRRGDGPTYLRLFRVLPSS